MPSARPPTSTFSRAPASALSIPFIVITRPPAGGVPGVV
jgi:hypothetical protein